MNFCLPQPLHYTAEKLSQSKEISLLFFPIHAKLSQGNVIFILSFRGTGRPTSCLVSSHPKDVPNTNNIISQAHAVCFFVRSQAYNPTMGRSSTCSIAEICSGESGLCPPTDEPAAASVYSRQTDIYQAHGRCSYGPTEAPNTSI